MIPCDLCGEPVKSEASSVTCGRCVQMLLNTPLDEIIRLYDIAMDKGYESKIRALKSFLGIRGIGKIKRRGKS